MDTKIFGRKSTAEQVARDISLKEKNVIVTGANSGIGKESARVLAKMGASVYLGCRNVKQAAEVAEEIKKETGNENVFVLELDLSSFESILKAANDFKSKNIPLHILLNNAGILSDSLIKKNKRWIRITIWGESFRTFSFHQTFDPSIKTRSTIKSGGSF